MDAPQKKPTPGGRCAVSADFCGSLAPRSPISALRSSPRAQRPTNSRHQPLATRHGGFAAFTLIELLVVITIIGILAGLTIATIGGVQKNSARNKAKTEVEALSQAIENYKIEMGSYPPETPETALFNELTGSGTLNRTKVYFEPPKSMYTNSRFIDPWGNFYTYEVDSPVNVGMFDIYSTAGQADANLYIRN
jgi:general secretion pathway protein G